MAPTTDKEAKQLAALAGLRDLAGQPEAQVRYALALLERERGNRVVTAAMRVLAPAADPAARPVLLRLYDYYAADGPKRDTGADLRIAILEALQPIAVPADRALAERAIATYELLPPSRLDSTGGLRAAGLLLLQELDPEGANYHAVRLLIDPHTSRMTGQPALAAVLLLATREQLLPLYYYVVNASTGVSEVVAECLKSLTGVPLGILAGLVAQFGETEDDLVLAGLFDLLLAHESHSQYTDLLTAFLGTTRRYNVYRYLATAVIAAHAPEMRTRLLDVARAERDPPKVEILVEALALAPGDPAVAAVLADLQRRAATPSIPSTKNTKNAKNVRGKA